ncbi:MAG: PAS domain-containing protein [Vampirovibrio sp.]|nr:PAS domain-containing protein [Vampirovibrio sp.]
MTNSVLDTLASEVVLNDLTSGVVVVDPSDEPTGRIIFANTAFLELGGWQLKEVMGQPMSRLFRLPAKVSCPLCEGRTVKPGEALFPPVHRAVLTVAESTLQNSPSKDAGSVKIKYSSLSTGQVLCLIDPFQEDQAISQAHTDFVSVVSHEFRTPLTSIKGFADTLLRYGTQLPADQQKRFITIIKDQSDRLTRMVENLLTVSKLGASRIDFSFRPVPLPTVIERVVQNLKAKGDQDKHYQDAVFQVSFSEGFPDIWADADKLEQVLLNLLDNAVKYSPDKATVTVNGNLCPADPEQVMIQISDQGVGIAKDHLAGIFSKFSRIDNPLTRDVEGTGLGLYITKSLTTAMDGDITLESEAGKGTTFTLTFPVATAERQAAYRRKLSVLEDEAPEAL